MAQPAGSSASFAPRYQAPLVDTGSTSRNRTWAAVWLCNTSDTVLAVPRIKITTGTIKQTTADELGQNTKTEQMEQNSPGIRFASDAQKHEYFMEKALDMVCTQGCCSPGSSR